MENTQVMTQAIKQATIGAVKAVVQAMTKVEGPVERSSGSAVAASMGGRTSGLSLKQPALDWKAQDNYSELLNF